jgi:hypothetical protein
MDKGNRKGSLAEEAMRASFRGMGYYAVRAIPYSIQEYHVTDIDLWLYGRKGLFRERINVDIKHKSTPKAMERILWALGAMRVLRTDRCIVATTERNPAVVEFGRRNGVSVVDGAMLQQCIGSLAPVRLSEEEFIAAISPAQVSDRGLAFRKRYDAAKRRLLMNLGYDGCNLFLMDILASMQDMAQFTGLVGNVRRLLYVLTSYVSLACDYLVSRQEFASNDRRLQELETGLRYGSAGRTRIDDFIRTLEACKTPGEEEANRVIEEIGGKLRQESSGLRVDMVAEYVVRQVGHDRLFDMAMRFEEAAFACDCPVVGDLGIEEKSFLMMLVDYCQIDRKMAVNW